MIHTKCFRFVLIAGMIISLTPVHLEAKTHIDPSASLGQDIAALEDEQKIIALEGHVQGKSKKAGVVTLQLDGQVEFIRFNEKTVGLDYANKGENVVVRYAGTKNNKMAIELKLHLPAT